VFHVPHREEEKIEESSSEMKSVQSSRHSFARANAAASSNVNQTAMVVIDKVKCPRFRSVLHLMRRLDQLRKAFARVRYVQVSPVYFLSIFFRVMKRFIFAVRVVSSALTFPHLVCISCFRDWNCVFSSSW
jgi:hypothetical protein